MSRFSRWLIWHRWFTTSLRTMRMIQMPEPTHNRIPMKFSHTFHLGKLCLLCSNFSPRSSFRALQRRSHRYRRQPNTTTNCIPFLSLPRIWHLDKSLMLHLQNSPVITWMVMSFDCCRPNWVPVVMTQDRRCSMLCWYHTIVPSVLIQLFIGPETTYWALEVGTSCNQRGMLYLSVYKCDRLARMQSYHYGLYLTSCAQQMFDVAYLCMNSLQSAAH